MTANELRERRHCPRVGLAKAVSLEGASGQPIVARQLDLGEGGLRGLAALGRARPGDRLTVRSRLPGWIFSRSLEIPAVLTRVASGDSGSEREFAVQFQMERAGDRRKLAAFVRRALRAVGKLERAQGSASPLADALRLVRMSLGHGSSGYTRVVLVTSSVPGEGTSFTAVHLAALLASEGNRVLLVDADLRSPSLHQIVGVSETPGLADLLADDLFRPLEDAIQHTRGGLSLLAAGGRTQREGWSHERAKALIEQLHDSGYDYAVLDSPAVLISATGPMLASSADDVLLVARAGQTRGRELEEARNVLERYGSALRGVVLNDRLDTHENKSPNRPRTGLDDPDPLRMKTSPEASSERTVESDARAPWDPRLAESRPQ